MINGVQCSWNDTQFKLGGVPYSGITSISYSHKLEPVMAYGMGKSKGPRGRTMGKYTADNMKIACFVDTANEIRKQLAALSANSKAFGAVEVPATLQFVPSGQDPQTVEFERCRLVSVSQSAEESSDPTKTELEFSIFRIRENGLTLFDSTDEA
jgi:hypothetical protein